ncbi:MAG: G5 domain-containing protein [Clostridia bacterium]|nr:G5 domain-containing protein [Clostridia bacterium]
MIKSEQASLSVMRIAAITVLAICILSVSVLASSSDVKNVKIVLADNCEIDVLTTKSVVSDILEENRIIVLPEENVVPNLDSEITDSLSTIIITGRTQDAYAVVRASEEEECVRLDSLLSSYNTITEKIVTIEEKIPYETIIKDASSSIEGVATSVLQEGEEGLKRSTYKIKYQNDIEIGRTLINEEIVKQAVNKIVQVTAVTSRSSAENTRVSVSVPTPSNTTLASKVEGMEPTIKTMNASAYTASECGKSVDSPGYGRTASGEKATAWHTIAAGSGYPMGTIIYIPYFKDSPNGGWFVVQDRGSSISNNKIDIYMNTYNECVAFGRRNLECYIYRVD